MSTTCMQSKYIYRNSPEGVQINLHNRSSFSVGGYFDQPANIDIVYT